LGAWRSCPYWQLSPGRASALAAEAELGPAQDGFLDLLEEPGAVGFVLLRDELSGRMLLVPFRIDLRRLAHVETRQRFSSISVGVGLWARGRFEG
jgi:hypothetical protein